MYSLCEIAAGNRNAVFPVGWAGVAVIGYAGPDEVVFWRRSITPAYECVKLDLNKLAATGVVQDSILMDTTFIAALDDIHVVVNPVSIDNETEWLVECKHFALQMKILQREWHIQVCTAYFAFRS